MLKVAITHDVDRIKKSYQYFTHFAKSVKNKNYRYALYHLQTIFCKEPYWTFPQIIKIESELNIKSTFFFLNESIKYNLFKKDTWKLALGRYNIYNKKLGTAIRWLDDNGWEIAVHGSFNSYKDYELLKKEKSILENIVGHEIIGVRQHYLNLFDKTWEFQDKAGFKYDSSYGYNENIGFKKGKYNVFFPLNNQFMVIPMVIMDNPFVHNCNNNWKVFLNLLNVSEQNDVLLVLNWHSNNFNEKEFAGYVSSFKAIINECLKRNAKFYRLCDYYNERLMINKHKEE